MTRTFQGRPVVPGTACAPALVSHSGVNTLASYQSAMLTGDKEVKCGDQNNPDLYKKPMFDRALCLPETIGSTTGGMVLYCVAALGKQPACLLFSKTIDSLAAAGAVLSEVWSDAHMPVVDQLGDEFLQFVQDGMRVTVAEDGLVTVEDAAPAEKNGANRKDAPAVAGFSLADAAPSADAATAETPAPADAAPAPAPTPQGGLR